MKSTEKIKFKDLSIALKLAVIGGYIYFFNIFMGLLLVIIEAIFG